MANFDYPTDTPIVTEDGRLTIPWGQWIQRIHNLARTLQDSGPSAQRPATLLWIGRYYFDTDLGTPIWVQQVKPTVVWCDATGTPV